MIEIRRLAIVGSAMGLMVTIVIASGCSTQTDSTPPKAEEPVNVTVIDGYALKGDPKSVIEYSGNELIFSGEVIGRDAARRVTNKSGDGGVLDYIYTPFTVKVESVIKGSSLARGQELSIRIIGGQVGSEKTVNEIGASPEQYKAGMKVILFTQPLVDAGDGLMAATPNFTYVDDSAGNVFNLHEPEYKTSRSLFETSASEWVAFNS